MKVEIARDIEALVPNYLDNRRLDAEKISALLGDGDLDGVARLGHRMKGNGASFGFHPISELGARFEHAALSRDIEAVRGLHSELVCFLDELVVVYR